MSRGDDFGFNFAVTAVTAVTAVMRGLWRRAVRPILAGRARQLAPIGVALLVGALGGGAVAARLARGSGAPPPASRPARTAPWVEVEAVAEPAAVDEADDPGDELVAWSKRPTPMQPEEAAQHLSDAWEKVLGKPPPDEALALLWAQWALETGRGRWMVDFNFAGVKGKAPRGGSAVWWTSEGSDDDARRVRRVRSRFRAYRSAEEGARDYVGMLKRRYPEAIRAARRGDAQGFVHALAKRGYFTSEPDAYCRALGSLSRQFLGDNFDGLPPS